MVKTKSCFLVVLCCFVFSSIFSQTIEIEGVVSGSTDVENIHVINKTSNKFTTTNKLGALKSRSKRLGPGFQASGALGFNDISNNSSIITEKRMTVFLEDKVNELGEVLVGKVLTGSLDSDIKNSDAERPINFYDVGLPGYKGKPKTQSERRLYEADAGKYVYVGLGVGLNLNKILNKISGRTKKLKDRVEKENNDVLLEQIKANLVDDFFITYPLDESMRTDFFYFCSDDQNFEKRCKDKSDIEVFEFLAEKMAAYKANLKLKGN